MLPSLTHWFLINCWSSSTVWAVRASVMGGVHSRRVAGQELGHASDRFREMSRRAPVLLDLQGRRQTGDLGAGLGGMRRVGPGLEQKRRAAIPHELAADREDEVPAEHVPAEAPDDVRAQRRVALEHRLLETADSLVPRRPVLVEADRVLQHGGGDAFRRQLTERQTEAGSNAATHDVEAPMPEVIHERE